MYTTIYFNLFDSLGEKKNNIKSDILRKIPVLIVIRGFIFQAESLGLMSILLESGNSLLFIWAHEQPFLKITYILVLSADKGKEAANLRSLRPLRFGNKNIEVSFIKNKYLLYGRVEDKMGPFFRPRQNNDKRPCRNGDSTKEPA